MVIIVGERKNVEEYGFILNLGFFILKKPPDKDEIFYLNDGMYLFKDEVLKGNDPGPSPLEKDIIPDLLDRNVFSYSVEAPQFDIGRPDRLNIFLNIHLASSTE